MSYQQSHLFRLLIIFGLFLITIQIRAAEREDLYEKGYIAYEDSNYIEALKYFYSFYIVNEESLNDSTDFMRQKFKKQLLESISECEENLNHAIDMVSIDSIHKGGYDTIIETVYDTIYIGQVENEDHFIVTMRKKPDEYFKNIKLDDNSKPDFNNLNKRNFGNSKKIDLILKEKYPIEKTKGKSKLNK